MKFKGIIYQNNPKRIHGSCEGIDLRLIRHDYVYEEEEHGYYYLVSAPYDDEGNIDFDKKQDVDEWYGIHEFQKGSIQDEDRRISEIWSISNDLLNITYRYQIANLKNLVKI